MIKLLILSILLSSLMAQENRLKITYSFHWWKELHLLNSEPFKSFDHRAYVDIYVNNIAKDSYVNKKTKFKSGSIIIKPLYPGQKREDIARLAIMMKMERGYDEEYNDWWYGVYDKTGTQMWYEGKILSCINCHIRAKKSDYLFTLSVMEIIELINEK
ncbi:MAG: cytochrome P460 family protein [Campylobacterota bacterium]